MEQIIKQLDRIEQNQDALLEKVEAVRIEAAKTNGRVTANEKEISKLWKVVGYGGGILLIVVLVLVARGILKVEQVIP